MDDDLIHNEDGRPLAQLFYDDLHSVIVKYESSGMTNAESIGIFEMLMHDMLSEMNKLEEE